MTGRTVAHGYNAQHKRLRARWAQLVEAGQVWCARCGEWIPPGTPWDLGHPDTRPGGIAPEHRACNRAAGLRKAIQRIAMRRSMWTRW